MIYVHVLEKRIVQELQLLSLFFVPSFVSSIEYDEVADDDDDDNDG